MVLKEKITIYCNGTSLKKPILPRGDSNGKKQCCLTLCLMHSFHLPSIMKRKNGAIKWRDMLLNLTLGRHHKSKFNFGMMAEVDCLRRLSQGAFRSIVHKVNNSPQLRSSIRKTSPTRPTTSTSPRTPPVAWRRAGRDWIPSPTGSLGARLVVTGGMPTT